MGLLKDAGFMLIIWMLHIRGIAVSDEKKLIKDLLEKYEDIGKVGRPVHNQTSVIQVQFGIALVQILDLDEKNQVLTTNVWGRYNWHDILLVWDPKDYGGVEHVRIPTEYIWTPDIVLYNYADDRLEEKRKALAVVSYKGEIIWIPQAIYKSTCSIDITHFPFDVQNCTMKFGSWTYDGFKLDIIFFNNDEKVDLNDYIPSNEWDVVQSPARRNVKKYPCCVEPYPDLTFTLIIRRKVAFYNYILILPCVLLSSLTLVLFWLPPESPAKMVLGMNIFVAFFVLLLLLAESTPPAASSIPLIGAYYCLNMIMITLSTFLSVIVINLYFRGDRRNRVPKFVKTLMIDWVARILCMRGELNLPPPGPKEHKLDKVIVNEQKEIKRKRKKAAKENNCNNDMKYNKFQMHETSTFSNHKTENTSPDKSPILMHQSMENDIREIRKYLRHVAMKMMEKESVGKITIEWRVVALVLDRVFFFMYLLAIIVSLATIFPKTES
ncbi:unnamed protein product [Owenia fusiformis]|uniref:Uncharacterized protein n=1 Tax=Owenia fusiformis TaxID=6347 RepID=A0A8S4PP52_OWEFU|nr:unnamed protein product [Owenia fusiformis]